MSKRELHDNFVAIATHRRQQLTMPRVTKQRQQARAARAAALQSKAAKRQLETAEGDELLCHCHHARRRLAAAPFAVVSATPM